MIRLLNIPTLVVLIASTLAAQDFRAGLTGLITDGSGASVVGARVKAVNIETNASTETTSNETGRYNIAFLLPGKYRVEVEAPGFKTYLREGIELQISVRAALDVKLEIGTLAEKLTVTSNVSLLETETASRGGIVDNDILLNVPNAGRNVFQIAFAMPGVHKPSTSQGTEFNLDGLANSRAAINGAASGVNGTENNIDVLIDGTSANKGDRQTIMIPALETVQEFRVLTNIYDAQYGRTGGGIITTTTKSGTNEFHGVVFDRYYDQRLSANSWQNNANGVERPSLSNHNYGFTATGPVWIPKVFDGRNKLFFMVANDQSPSSSLYNSQFTTPTPEQKRGNFSNLVAANGQRVVIYDPLSTQPGPGGTFVRTPFPGNIIPNGLINPVGQRIVNNYPDPTSAGTGPAQINNFFQSTNNEGQLWQWTGRMDVRVGNNDSVFGRYGETNMTRCCDQRYPTGNPAETSTILPRGRRGRTLTLDWTRVFNPTTTFNLRAGFSRLENLAWNPQTLAFNPTDLGLPASLVAQMARPMYPSVNMGQYMSQGSSPFTQADDTYTLAASGGKVFGSHVARFGVELRDFRANNVSFGASGGSFTFSRQWTQADPNRADALSGNEIASALLGYSTSGGVEIPISPAWRSKFYAFFFQDDWKITRKLTINLGLRWDYESPVTERYNRQTRGFAFGVESPIASQVRGRPGVDSCAACRGLTGGLIYAGTSGDERYAFAPDRNNFQPRIGFAYALDSKTVIRGGFGLYALGQWALGPNTGYSRTTPQITTIDGLKPTGSMSNPFPGGVLQPIGSSLGLATDLGLGLSVNYVDRPLPLSKQTSFGIQRTLWGGMMVDVSYVGNFTNQLPTALSLNFIPTNELGRAASYYSERIANPMAGLLPNNVALNGATIPRQSLLVAFPQYSGVTVNNVPVGRNSYNSLQISVQKRFANGINFQANYMNSKALEQLVPLNSQDVNPLNPLESQLEKRLTLFDVSQKLALIGTYALPVGKGRRFFNGMHPVVNGFLGNWNIGWNTTFQGGFPINFPNAAPLQARSAKLSGSERTMMRWFDTSLFPRVAGPAPFTLRDFPTRFPDVRFMGLKQFDFSITKDIPIFKERIKTQVRADFINAFNTPYFTNIQSLNVTTANFGQLTPSQNNPPRTIYLEFRMRF